MLRQRAFGSEDSVSLVRHAIDAIKLNTQTFILIPGFFLHRFHYAEVELRG
jgi:hypothetical protein